MKNNFEKLINSYRMLLEQPQEMSTPDAGGTMPDPNVAMSDPNAAGAAPAPQAAPVQPSSVGYAILVKLLLDAFKTLTVRVKDDIKFSDNVARTSQEAYRYLDIVKRNLEPDLQRKTQEDIGKGGNDVKSVDSADIINIANLALKALFFTPKDPESAEYNDIANKVVDVNNAKSVFEMIRNVLSER